MRLPDSASVFTAEVWAVIKAMEHIKDAVASKCIIFAESLSCRQAVQYVKLEHHVLGLVIEKCVLLNLSNKDIFLLALDAMKRQTLLPCLLWIFLVLRMVYPIMMLNIVSVNKYYCYHHLYQHQTNKCPMTH